jgi:hypothetical protein
VKCGRWLPAVTNIPRNTATILEVEIVRTARCHVSEVCGHNNAPLSQQIHHLSSKCCGSTLALNETRTLHVSRLLISGFCNRTHPRVSYSGLSGQVLVRRLSALLAEGVFVVFRSTCRQETEMVPEVSKATAYHLGFSIYYTSSSSRMVLCQLHRLCAVCGSERNMSMGQWWNDTEKEKPRYSQKSPSQSNCVQKSCTIGPGSNSGPSGGKCEVK